MASAGFSCYFVVASALCATRNSFTLRYHFLPVHTLNHFSVFLTNLGKLLNTNVTKLMNINAVASED